MSRDNLLLNISNDNSSADADMLDSDHTLLSKYQAYAGICICGAGSAVLVIAVATIPIWCSNSDFLHFGPSSSVKFASVPIDTWTKWSVVITYSVLSQLAQSIVSATISPWVTNVIRDHKTPYNGSWCVAQSVITVYNLFSWLVAVLDTFLWITSELQYLAPALVTDLVIGMFTTHTYLRRKLPHNALMNFI